MSSLNSRRPMSASTGNRMELASRISGQDQEDSAKLSSLKSLQRPGSAVARKKQQLHMQQYQGVQGNGVAKHDNQKLEQLWLRNQRVNDTREAAVWQAFGAYLAKVMKSGKGVSVPNLGTFTFTPISVDLAGTTNPAVRDKQERLPVFLVGKDFAKGIPLRQGIAGGAGAGQIREYNGQSANGIIPVIKVNYIEVAMLAEDRINKDVCRTICEYKFKSISDRVRKGESISEAIPNLGKLLIRNGMAGVTFDSNLIDQARGQTAKNFADKLFQTNNNLMNNKLLEPDPQRRDKPPLPHAVKNAMKKLDVNQLQSRSSIRDQMAQQAARRRQGSEKENDSRTGGSYLVPSVSASFAPGSLEKVLQGMNDSSLRKLVTQDLGQNRAPRRPISSFRSESGQLRQSKSVAAFSQTSSRASYSSAMSRVPELAPFQLMNLANDIYMLRSQICSQIQKSNFGSMSLRDSLSSSKIQQIIAKAGQRIEIGHLKALLKELGFNWNGPSCSISQLLQALKTYLNPHLSQGTHKTQSASASNQIKVASTRSAKVGGDKALLPSDQHTLLGLKVNGLSHTWLEIIKELFYTSKRSLYEIYREVVTRDSLDSELFCKIVSKYSNNVIAHADACEAFEQVCKSFAKPTEPNKDYLTWQEFEKSFKVAVPDPEQFQNEIRILQQVKTWMQSRKYDSEEGFERLLRSANRIGQRTLHRYEFHKAVVENGVKLTAPEIDYFFDILTGFKNLSSTLLGQEQWNSKIADEKGNPLQVLRQIAQKYNLDRERILKAVDLRLWDPALDFDSFLSLIRKLDASLSEQLAKDVFIKLQNRNQKVEIETLLANICGSESETIDFKVSMFKTLYIEIYQKQKQKYFLNLCEGQDKRNDGKIEPDKLEGILKQLLDASANISMAQVRNFVKQIKKDQETGKVCYVSFMESVAGLGNKSHNPFQQVLQKLELFVETNNLKPADLVKRAGASSSDGVTLEKFAQFLKQKVDKSRPLEELNRIVQLMDIDKDGYIDHLDVSTCLSNIDSTQFVQESGKALEKPQFQTKQKFYTPEYESNDLPEAKVISICKSIIEAMNTKGYTTKLLFTSFDANQDGMLTLNEFKKGVSLLITISSPILDKLFAKIDKYRIGMIDFQQFQEVLEAKAPTQLPRSLVEDGFQWQQDVIKAIKRYANSQKLAALDVFRYFDQDFDGLISKEDMKISLNKYLEIPVHKIDDHRLDRLFRLLGFYKSEMLQPSDFDRLLTGQNPFLTACQGQTKTNFKKTMGGGLADISTHDWMFAAIQQIGLCISNNYTIIDQSFQAASNNSEGVNFQNFKAFIEKHDALSGFNVTVALLRQLFASLDPHKKTFMSKKDWTSSFNVFNQNDHLLMELKNYLQCQFSDVNSAFGFLQTFGTSSLITLDTFSAAVKSLLPSRKYSQIQMKHLYNAFLRDPTDFRTGFNMNHFGYQFEQIQFKGKQRLITQSNPNNKGGYTTTITTATNPNWERDVIVKLRSIIDSSGKNVWQIFNEFDADGSGTITTKEFRNAMRKLQLGLTSKEIDKIMQRIDLNGDGLVNFDEFNAVLGANQGFDQTMKLRANNKLAQLKEQMHIYLTSHADAYRKFDQSKVCKMTFSDFNLLVTEMCKASSQQVPSYTVMKDLFDAVDIKKDGYIDLKEWNQTFNALQGGGPSSAMKAGPLASWENSNESNQIGELMNRNRKAIIENFKRLSTHSSHDGTPKYVTFSQAKAALSDVIYSKFPKGMSDAKLQQVLSVGQIPDHSGSQAEPLYAFMKIMDLFKERYKPVV